MLGLVDRSNKRRTLQERTVDTFVEELHCVIRQRSSTPIYLIYRTNTLAALPICQKLR